jgi:phosphatidylglycerol:prolipoprotein diacylglycerol transferase
MGQYLTMPMIIVGLYLVLTAAGRRQRVEPVAGPNSVV